jgi:hypothetical protein
MFFPVYIVPREGQPNGLAAPFSYSRFLAKGTFGSACKPAAPGYLTFGFWHFFKKLDSATTVPP